MNHKQILPGIGAALGMLILILDGKTALEGAQVGIDLCLRTVIPSLFPFFILSIVLTSSFMGARLPLLSPIQKLCGIPEGAESILISGFLGGYPVGAQCISTAFHTGQLSKKDAERMLAFCNNAGPAFLFGMVATMFPNIKFTWALWGIHIASALCVALWMPGKTSQQISICGEPNLSVSKALQSSLRIMASVCGWIVLFRVMISFGERWFLWMIPVELQVLLKGFLELSNGCCELNLIPDLSVRFLICSSALAFGGLCVTMQTVSVTKGLSLRMYFIGKLLQAVFSLTLATGLIYQQWIPAIGMLLILLWKNRKNSSIHATVGV